MAETQDATIGYGGTFSLHNGSTLYELVEVKRFQIPSPGTREQVETTHLKSPGYRREYVSGFYEDTDFEVVLNTRLRSDTDVLIAAALAAGDARAFEAGIPENGAVGTIITGTAKVIAYERGEVSPEDVIESTVTLRVVTISAPSAGS